MTSFPKFILIVSPLSYVSFILSCGITTFMFLSLARIMRLDACAGPSSFCPAYFFPSSLFALLRQEERDVFYSTTLSIAKII
jgi:hypothetical protein